MSDTKLPTTLKGVTPEWLTSLLRSSSVLPATTSVVSIDKSPVEGGFNSTVTRLKVVYSEENVPPAPSSFIIKFSVSRGHDTSSEKELYFYERIERISNNLSHRFRPPKVYLAGKSGRTYIFLLEDLGQLIHHQQKLGGADYETTRQVVDSLVDFHASFWSTAYNAFDSVRDMWCLVADQDKYYRSIQGYLEMAVNDFDELMGEDAELQKIVKFCATKFVDLVEEARKPPCTLLHGDARLSNYFFNGKELVAVDWQGFNVGSGVGELAYFLSMSVKPEVLQQHEDELLHQYYNLLNHHTSTEEFSYSDFFQKYLIGIATTAAIPLLTARGVLEGRKFIKNPPSNPALADHAKMQIAMHDNVKPMIEAWCATARRHQAAILSIPLLQ